MSRYRANDMKLARRSQEVSANEMQARVSAVSSFSLQRPAEGANRTNIYSQSSTFLAETSFHLPCFLTARSCRLMAFTTISFQVRQTKTRRLTQ